MLLYPVSQLHLSQLYLSKEKIEKNKQWLSTDTTNAVPIEVADLFADGTYTIIDGHTRAFLWWTLGLEQVPVTILKDASEGNRVLAAFYPLAMKWCKENHLYTISDLKNRQLSAEKYESLWLNRCQESIRTLENEFK